MTVMMKSNMFKKPDFIKTPLVDDRVYEEDHIEIHDPHCQAERSRYVFRVVQMFCFTLLTLLVVIVTAGLLLYGNYYSWKRGARFEGYCAVPVDDDVEERQLDFRVAPAAARFGDKNIFKHMMEMSEGMNSDKYLEERLEIGDDVERIYLDSGDSFIHDWGLNISGIISTARCFLMSMEPSLALPPAEFVRHISRAEQFSVSPVRVRARAQPAPPAPAAWRDLCRDRPAYTLVTLHTYMRKRSADQVKPHFVHFAGKHLHEIEITNMEELVEREAKNNLPK